MDLNRDGSRGCRRRHPRKIDHEANLVTIATSVSEHVSDRCRSDSESDYEFESEAAMQPSKKKTFIIKTVVCEVVTRKKKKKRGGKLNTKSYMQKAECLDDSMISQFLVKIDCNCQKNCIIDISDSRRTSSSAS